MSVKKPTRKKKLDDHAPLSMAERAHFAKLDHVDAGYLNGVVDPAEQKRLAKEAARQKRAEYTANMGRTDTMLREISEHPDDARVAAYVSTVAEDERRFINRRRARSVSIAHARDVLLLRSIEELSHRLFWGKIQPKGYAKKRAVSFSHRAACAGSGPTRVVNLHLSDLHIGARLDPSENLKGFGWSESARRLASVVQQAADYKPRYRDTSALHVYLNGDVINGLLAHDALEADSFPLTEQIVAAIRYLSSALGYLASAYQKVNVFCSSGNHGRNIQRHPGRATTQKWDGFETIIYTSVLAACAALPNVQFTIPRTPYVVVPVFDHSFLQLHGDTDVKLGSPDTRGALYRRELDSMNAARRFGTAIKVMLTGHFHTARYLPFPGCAALINGALVPALGYGRSAGYQDEQCCQWLWESTAKYPVGDMRNLLVGEKEDGDSSLDQIVCPFDGRFD